MNIGLCIVFFLIAVVNVAIFANKKKSRFMFFLAIGIIFILMTFNYGGPDVGAYCRAYNSIISANGKNTYSGHMERGYQLLMLWSGKAGLGFIGFRVILSVLCLALFTNTIKYYKANGNGVIGLYMFYSFFFDTIQIRNCIVQFIILFAIRFLFKKSAFSTFIYIILVLLASSIHTVSIIYLLLLLLKISPSKAYYQALFILSVTILIMATIMRPIVFDIAEWVLMILGRGDGYLDGKVSVGHFTVFAIFMLGVLPLYFMQRSIAHKTLVRKRVNDIYKIHIIMSLCMVVLLLDGNFYRIFRNMIPLNIIGLCLIYSNSKKNSNGAFALLASAFLVGAWIFRDFFLKDLIFYEVYNPIFEYNLLFDGQLIGSVLSESIIVLCVCIAVIVIFGFVYRNFNKENKNVRKRKKVYI